MEKLLGYLDLTIVQLRLADEELASDLETALAAREHRALADGEPIGAHPGVRVLIDEARLAAVVKLAGLSAGAVEAVSALGGLDAIGPFALADLRTKSLLTAAQAEALGADAELYAVCDGHAPLIEAIRDDAGAVRSEVLATRPAAAWVTTLSGSPAALPPGSTLDETARIVARRFAAMCPAAALKGRMPPVTEAPITMALIAAAALETRNTQRFGRRFDQLDLTGIPSGDVPAVRAAWEMLEQAVRAYPGQDLDGLFDAYSVTPSVRAKNAQDRVALVTGAVTAGGGPGATVDVLRFDLTASSGATDRLALDALSDADRARVLETLRAYQRVHNVTADIDDTALVLRAGFSSAHRIAALPRAAFAAAIGLPPDRADTTWTSARTAALDAALYVGGLVDQMSDGPAVTTTPPSVNGELAQLAGYASLFGDLSFCDCTHCASVLGPAAYFVDLMAFVDRHVRSQLADFTDHPLDLRTRRPDLWTLPLTCANTNDRVPTLDLILERLENELARRAHYSGSWTDRAAIEALVYPGLATQFASLRQPFDVSLARLDALLAVDGVTRLDVAHAVGLGDARIVMGLSEPEYDLIQAAPPTTLGELNAIFGLTFTGSPSAVDEVDAAVLADAMAIDRAILGATISTWLVQHDAPGAAIVPARRTLESVQNDVEWARGLTVEGLHQMHILTRIARHLGWQVTRVDRVLRAANAPSLASTGFETMAIARGMATRFGATLTDDDLVALAGTLDAPALDRRYNPRFQVSADGAWPQPSRHFVHPALRTQSPPAPDAAVGRLTSGLGLGLADLELLVRYLAPQLARESAPGFDPDAAVEADRYFVLSVANLSLLTRHVVVARRFELTIAELVRLLRLAGIAVIDGLLTVATVAELVDTWRTSGRSLDELEAATGQTSPATPDPGPVITAVQRAATEPLMIGDNVFAVALGMSETASRDVFVENPMLFGDRPAGGRWLAADADLATISVPGSALVPDDPGRRLATADELRTVLQAHSAATVLLHVVGQATRRSDAEVAALIALAGRTIDADVVRGVRGDGPPDRLGALIAVVTRLSVALRGWDAEGLALLGSAPAKFGPGAWPELVPGSGHPSAPWFTLEQVWTLATYARLNAPAQVSALRAAVVGFDPATATFDTDAELALAGLLGTARTALVGLRGLSFARPGAPAAIAQMGAAVAMTERLQVDGENLIAALSTELASRSRAADALAHSLEMRAVTNAGLSARVAEAATAVRERRRDALVESLIRASEPRFADTVALSNYFLSDVAAGGCATTSRVIEAIGTVQQYVQRVVLGVERTTTGPGLPHVALTLPDEVQAEWEWRRTYRVWEANRKVFLWPENYLEPTLRDDATPLYRQLEADLAQSDLDEATILNAYSAYLRGVETLATLAIAGAYHDVSGDNDTLHLVGVSAQDPPTFYYRSCTDLRASGCDPTKLARWSAWQPIDVAIPSRFASPVVYEGRLHLLWASVSTRVLQDLANGNSNFRGYRHQFALASTSLLPDGRWTAPQELALPDAPIGALFAAGRGTVEDPYTTTGGGRIRFDDLDRTQVEPVDGYTLTGRHWLGVWPYVDERGLWIYFRDFRACARVDLYGRRVELGMPTSIDPPPRLLGDNGGNLSAGCPLMTTWPADVFGSITIDYWRRHRIEGRELSGVERSEFASAVGPTTHEPVASVPSHADRFVISGSPEDAIVDVHHDVVTLQGSVTDDDRYVVRRVGSTVAATLSRRLFERGIDDVLDTARQLELAEAALPMTDMTALVIDRSGAGTLDYDGPFGTYFREIWMHVPIAIATALQAQGRYADARRWFHRVFDPTAAESIDTSGVPAEDIAHRQLDRVWRYRELRGLDARRVRAILTDGAALDQYRRDPFNPHAIARRRPTAYQKFVFRRYVENLLDWADQLFAQFTMETVDEARLLYQYAAELLGRRPRRLGECGDQLPEPRDYLTIAPLLDGGNQLLIEVENELATRASIVPPPAAPAAAPLMATSSRQARVREAATWDSTGPAAVPSFAGGWNAARTASWAAAKSTAASDGPLGMGGRTFEPASVPTTATDGFPAALWQELGPVFCVPSNRDLSKLWDRVDDRLWKIHHCLDLDGQRRELALLAPEIDPSTRVAAAALGLDIDDLVGEAARDVPPYRFAYLIERAKGYASALAGFGGALLSALERRDGAALGWLRYEQGLSLARMTTGQRELDVQVADEGLATVSRQREAAEYRHDYYTELADQGRSVHEVAETAFRRNAFHLRGAGAAMFSLASVARFIPQMGSVFAMTFGGTQIGGALTDAANHVRETASAFDAAGASAGLEASFARRRESWLHQAELARRDVDALLRQERAAELRVRVARRGLAMHLESVTQLEDVMTYERERFTNLALHTRLAALLQRLYRTAYGHALALARLAERAFRFERGDDAGGLGGDYWDAAQGGLLAGERLLSDLHGLERRFLETNHRELEIDQPFALSQVDPAALVALRETGTCELEIPEMAFEVAYPGHWKRRLRSVRLTIPCVTGPYVNVGATLELLESKVRPDPGLEGELVVVPPAHGLAIATSTAQNDGGVFEMSFRDERYLPFEGLGAISRWRITLPRVVRPFDYASMTDVVLSLAYSARPDAARRERAEEPSAATAGSILHHYTNVSTTRILGLRQDLSGTFARLVRSAAGTAIGFEISDRQLAAVFRGRDVDVVSAALALRVAPDISVATTALTVDGAVVGGFVEVPALGGLMTAAITGTFLETLRGPHTIAIQTAGGLAPASPAPGDAAAVDPDHLLDVLLVLEVRLRA